MATEFQPSQQAASQTITGEITSEPLTWTHPSSPVTVGVASGTLVGAGVGTGRVVQIYVPTTATTGIFINLTGAAATTQMLIEPGQAREYATEGAITAIRAGASDVTVYVAVGVGA